MRDIEDPRWMFVKAALFGVLLVASGVVLWLRSPTWTTAALVALVAWCSARLYYFCFYVIERYIDPDYRFSGLGSALAYLLRRRGGGEG